MRFTIPVILFFSNFILAQNERVDTLKKFNYSELKNKFYEYYDNNKVLQSEQIAQYYLQKARKEKNALEIAEGYNLIHFNKDFPTALKYTDSLGIITKKIKGNLYPARTYLIKGNLYYKHDNLKAALDNYIIGLKYAKEQKDEKQIAFANMNIAYINSYIGRNAEAAKIFRYYLYNKSSLTDNYQHSQIHMALASCYLEINKLDSANILIKEGQASASSEKNDYNFSLYSCLSGIYDLKLKRYKTAITKLSKAYDDLIKINETNANYALYNLGKAYNGLKDKEKAIETFVKLDSNIQKSENTFFELRDVYTYLIDYYKEKNDKEKQLYYIERFIKVDKKLDEQFKYLSTELPKKYDTPNLLQEKESIINDLQNRKMILNVSIGFLSVILVLLSFLYSRSKKRERQHRKIAQELINSVEMKSFKTQETDPIIPSAAIKQAEIETEDKTIKTTPEDITQFILKELETFENKELFLKKGITSASLAKSIKTNTTYLSEVINTQKGKNFATYLNDLRIDYALNRLIKDKKFRSYKLLAIAEELGYNNEQAFSLAFKKKTGITLSVYIKEIEKSNNSL